MANELLKIGDITHYFTRIEVAVVDLIDSLKVGDEIHIKGATTDFKQIVESMQIEHEKIEKAGPGDSIGLVVKYRVRAGDEVFKL
jgi:translation elongation factor EF-1alpha